MQIPLGTTQGGDAGRNILTGPGIIDFDFALFKQFHWGESKVLEFRWEVYDVFNHPLYGYLLGNVFSSNAQPTPGFAFSPHATAAGVTGVTPENAIDANNHRQRLRFPEQRQHEHRQPDDAVRRPLYLLKPVPLPILPPHLDAKSQRWGGRMTPSQIIIMVPCALGRTPDGCGLWCRWLPVEVGAWFRGFQRGHIGDIMSASGRGSGARTAHVLGTNCHSSGTRNAVARVLVSPPSTKARRVPLCELGGDDIWQARGSRERSRPRKWVRPRGWKSHSSGKPPKSPPAR